MLIVRGTKKLRDRLEAAPAADGDESTTALGDWFATALFWRPQVALLVNQRTFLPVFMELAPARTLLDRVPSAIAEVLALHGVHEDVVAGELAAMSTVRIAPTNDRRVVGVMNEYAFVGKQHWEIEPSDLRALSLRLSQMVVGPLRDRSGFPDRELAAVLGGDEPATATVIPFPRRPAPDPEDAEASAPAVAAPGPPVAGAAPVPPGRRAPRSGSARAKASRAGVFQLKVTLDDTRPPIWRRILVDGNSTLDQLHEVIQAAFGWWDYHLHEFEAGGTRYGVPDPDWDWGPPPRDERRTRLASIAGEGTRIAYVYDFGDSWDHRIVVEKVRAATDAVTLPACIDGRRACPPEDCGGTWGYRELLEILADPEHPEHHERRAWIGRPFDPEAFDPAEFAHNLSAGRLAMFDDE